VIVNTNNGRVQGDLENGYRIFRGIPYGESTAPPNRYQNS
jgi:carboxylesterase type B